MIGKKRTQLIFSDDGTSVALHFANGAGSIIFETKEDAIYAVVDCFCKGRIHEDERIAFIVQIQASELPHTNEPCRHTMLVLREIPGTGGRMLIDPMFEMCTCSCAIPHGYIKSKNFIVDVFVPSKEEGIDLVGMLHDCGYITREEETKLSEEIRAPGLPQEKFRLYPHNN